jgi:ERCC4-type nuclease
VELTPFKVKEILDSMEIIIDTREQDTPRARRRYATFGVPYQRATLDFGDYTHNVTLDGEKPFYASDSRVIPHLAIERKMNLDELAGCFTHDRKRFEREMERVKDAGARMVLLVENATWENLINGRYRSKFTPQAFLASIVAWTIRYDLALIFCKEETSGRLIKEFCYRDLKERIEKSEFNEV